MLLFVLHEGESELKLEFYFSAFSSIQLLCVVILNLKILVSYGNKTLRYTYRYKWYTAATFIVLLLDCDLAT